MKHKFGLMGRVAITLVLALSLSLVMAVPVAADVNTVTVENDPQTEGRAAEYTIDFTTEAALFLDGPSTITITFPAGTTVPVADITAAKVTVNGTACTVDAVTTDQVVVISVPKDIAAGAVEVVIAADSGILNPDSVATDWTLEVKTSAETTGIDSAAYSTIAVVAPTIVSVVGTAYQNSNDTIVITFSEEVQADTEPFDATGEFAIECGGIALTLTNADFSPATGLTETLTITLAEAEANLEIGTDNLEVTPVENAIENEFEDAVVGITPVIGSVTGDTVAPTVALTYSISDRPVKNTDTLTITATFSEAMQATPTIAINTLGTDLEATVMAETDSKVWTYAYDVPADSDGTATVTISGDDLAGNANQAATNNTFVIDNTLPTIAVTDIVGTTISGADDTIEITFSEAVTATWVAAVFTKIESVVDETPATLTLTNAVFAIDDTNTVLTITLSEADDGEYLVNGETLTVTPAADAIKDAALNAMAVTAIEGTVLVTGDLVAPTITGIVGDNGAGTIEVVFSEAVFTADGEAWGADEVALVESPDGAPLNINNADFDANNIPDTGMATVLTITLDTTDDDASLVAGEVIYVTLAADAIVDLAGNPLAAVEVSSGAEAGWLEVWVDTAGTDDWKAEPTNFATITEGIAAVAEGGTVNVLPGTYDQVAETFPLQLDKAGVTLQSTGITAETVISNSATETVINIGGTAGAPVNTPGVTVDGFTVTGTAGIYCADADDAIIQNNIFTFATPLKTGIDVSVYATGVTVSGNELNEFAGMILHGSDCTVSDNTFGHVLNFWALGLLEGVTITGNTFPANTDANFAILLRGDAVATTIDDTLIEDNTLDGRKNGGILIGADSTGGLTVTNLTITGNDITNNGDGTGDEDSGVRIWSTTVWGDGNVINNNNITGNEDYGILNEMTDVEVDATDNWWGDANGPTHTSNPDGEGAEVTDDVDYSPWLDAPYPYGKSIETTGHFTIDLVAGWNLISLPLIPTDSDIDAVLADLIGQDSVLQVRTFPWVAGEQDEQYWIPAPGSTLSLMEDGWGYWIEMSEADALVVTGSEDPDAGGMQPSYDLHEGWNLIGYKSLSPTYPAVDYLGPAIAGCWDTEDPWGLIAAGTIEVMYSYDAATEVYELVVVPRSNGGATTLVPGQGYWLAVSAAGTIYP